ncbi:sugar transferase [Clostridiaceae bacterium AF42-6]|nr:sugar transferase [Clostridiales bacterium AM23-16LB]RHO81145.1 sugar transferase [Clostridiaceae bacterium AF42-6]RHQ26905.1 sugar transferase [Clostridiaceae bacterium AF29-16BH]
MVKYRDIGMKGNIRMDKFDQYKRLLRLGIAGIEIFIETLFFVYVWDKVYRELRVTMFLNKGNWMMIGFYVLYLIVFVYLYGGTKYAYYKKGQLILSQTLGTIIANALMYIQIIMVVGRFPFPTIWPMLVMSAADLVVIMLINQLSDGIFKKMFPPKRLLLICDMAYKENLIRKLSGRKDLYTVTRCVSAAEPLVKLQQEVQDCDAMMLYGLEEQKRNDLVKFCYEKSIRIYVAPEISDLLLRGADRVHSFDTPFLLLRNSGISFEQRVMKRAMDVIISGCMLLVASPFMLLTAIAIKMEDHGPALFKQERVTLNGRKFYIYKFRSMIVDAEKNGAQFSSKNDSRITKVGKFIRATRLDELPQLLNILKGDMSIVGPRPERQQYIDEFCKETPEFIYRLKVKAGLTGYAQIYGKYNTTPLDKLKLDLMYIESYSVLLDMKLIFLTLKIMFTKESTEGVDEGQNHA